MAGMLLVAFILISDLIFRETKAWLRNRKQSATTEKDERMTENSEGKVIVETQ
jgi:hypothetical protein